MSIREALRWINEAEHRLERAKKAHHNSQHWDEPLYGDYNNQPSYDEWIEEAFAKARAALASEDGWREKVVGIGRSPVDPTTAFVHFSEPVTYEMGEQLKRAVLPHPPEGK